MGFRLQLRLLLWKNLTLKKRRPFVLMFEIFIPLVLFFILLGIRKKQPAYPVGSSVFTAYPLPSAGVIAIMQAFCDNGERDSYGFNNFTNSTVKSFLEKLNTVSQHHNFFQPDFTPSDMDQIPGIYRSLVEDPVAVHDSFLGASDIPTKSLFKGLDDLESSLIKFSLPEDGIKFLFNSTLDMKKVYELVFGSHQDLSSLQSIDPLLLSGAAFLPSLGIQFGPSLSHLEAVVQLVHKHRNNTQLLWKGLEWIFNINGSDTPLGLNASQLAKEIKNLAFSSAGITLLCEEHGITKLLNFPTHEKEMRNLETTLCQMNQTSKLSILEELKAHLDSAKLQESLKMNEWNLSIARQRVRRLADDLKKFHVFETALREMSELASALPQDACHEPNITLSANDTVTEKPEDSEEQTEKKQTKDNPHYGLLRIWLGMQRMICGKDTKSTTSPPKDGADMNMDELGMSQYQQEQMGLLVHVLYSNPKVLFAPNSTDADQIIVQANKTFELLDTVTQYAKKMLNVSEEIRDFLSQNTTDHSLSVLREIQQNLHKYPFLLNMSGNSVALHEFADGSIISDKETFLHQLDLIDNAACSWISLMDGLSLNVFQGFRNEEDLLTYFKERAYFDNVTVLASVIFKMEPNGSLPNHMVYRIRQNASFTSTTTLVRNMFWFPGPRNWGYQYYQFGFVWIQDILERAMINLYAERDVIEPGSYIHQFPYPCYLQDQFLFMIEHVMPLCLAISWVYSVSMLVQSIVYEKEQRLKEVMKTMGMNNAVHWLAWFITSFVQMTITAATLTAILKYGEVLTYSNPLVIFFMLEIFVVANITFSFLVSSLYSKAKLAAACAGIIYFLTYVPYMYIAVREEAAHDHIPAWLKSIACLLSTTAFGLGAKYFAFYEEVGVGVQWSNIGVSPVEDDEFSLQNVALMMVMDTFLYSILVWYIENVHPGAYGLPKPWYFPLTKSYWMGSYQRPDGDGVMLLSRLWQRMTNRKGLSVIEDDQACAMANRTEDCRFFEPDPIHLPLGVCIDNLVKVYKSGNKKAVNKLSINLFEGQITSFLGHNGAGKTTTMSILTGLFPPTSGYATIYNRDIRTEMDVIRQSMGMCPQHNVLFDELTVEEHLRFYARMKGMTETSINLEVEKMIEDLNLPHKRNSKVNYLSGGTKRKLSVAIAFVAGSQVVILDEPTAGVDPYSRRAIWDLILKYKRGRTILLSTHHMDEADILGDRIAIISHGQLRCCGSSLFLKNNLGEGYHLYMVKQPLVSLKDDLRECQQEEVTRFICQHVSTAFLMSESKHELHYVLPLSELRKGSFEKLFTALENSLPHLGISSYGIKNTTLEEVFLQVAEANYRENSSLDGQRSVSPSPTKLLSMRSPRKLQNLSKVNGLAGVRNNHQERVSLINHPISPEESELGAENEMSNMASTGTDEQDQDADDDLHVPTYTTETPRYSPLAQDTCILNDQSTWDGAGTYRVEGNYLLFQQFMAILFKRYYCTRRNWKGLFSQILLPAFFVSIAMSVALTAPKIEDLPPMILSPSQYYNYTQPEGNVIGYATNFQDLSTYNHEVSTWSQDANSLQLIQTLHLPSGVGATCVLKSSFVNMRLDQLDFSIRNYELLSAYFEPICQSVFVHGIRLDNFVPIAPTVSSHVEGGDMNVTLLPFTEMPNSQEHYYPKCRCSDDQTGYVCEAYGLSSPPSMRVVTGDVLLNITGQYEHDYYLYTTDMFRLRRYGAFSFGLVRDHVPPEFGKDAPPLFRKVAVRNVAKVWFNNKGFHSMPTYINSMNNAILRANLPKEKGNPATYGITVINHPMTDTTYMLSRDQILQGTDVLIAIFIIVAMSFVPASFVLFLVYERYTKAKHLQFVSGVNAVCYWVANYFWDMCSYVVPATCCVLILLIFDIPAYASHKNLPAVVSLFLMYGWSITPVMYPVSFLFKEPSTAYIFLIVINLFVGITCVVTSFLLEVFSENAYLGEVHKILKTTFLMFPNYCLGRGLMDIAFNEYQNFFLFKTGQYEKMQSPFAWALVSRKLLAMALSGLAFFIITLLCEFRFFRKPKNSKVPDYPVPPEDEDVAAERWRVLTGRADNDLLKILNLTKVYQTRKLGKQLAVNKICLGVPEGECLGLLGVNGAGKSTTFKMLTGDMDITSGDAYLNSYSVQNELQHVQQYIGYCPQFDALYDELTAREHLQLYSRFRGIPRKEEKKVVDWALRKLDLVPYADRPSGTYSGGNKRKLSTAIALLGAPPVIYLDEPTTGMDPYTRRFLWDLILDLVRGGRAVVLTSHSMEECEALCTRLAIMVNGTFKCMGSIQHLKNRFGEGYYITLKSRENDLHTVQRWFRRTFPDATLKEKHYNMLQYELKSGTISLSYVFSKMESALHDLPIEEYSVCQNTLDNVFINFVKQQSELGGSDSSLTQQQPPKEGQMEECSVRQRQSAFSSGQDEVLEETSDDDLTVQITRSQSRLAFLHLDVDC